MPLNRSVNWEGTTYIEADVGESLIEAMLADLGAASTADNIGDGADARDRVFMGRAFFGEANVRAGVLQELAELGL